jgi:RES domain-containing protein
VGELNRTDVAQQPPREDQLDGFPITVCGELAIYRAKEASYGAWHFSSVPPPEVGPGGRWNLPRPRGACYWADSPLTALREVIGPYILRSVPVTSARLERLRIATGKTTEGERFADVTAATAADHGVISELSVMGDYSVPQAWAAGFDSRGLNGIRYSSRFTSEGKANAWAFFGDADSDGSDRFEGQSLDPFEVCEKAQIRVVATPSPRTKSTDLTAAEVREAPESQGGEKKSC